MRQFTSPLTVLTVQPIRSDTARGDGQLACCAMITHHFDEAGALRLLLQSTTRDMVPNEAAMLDWIEKRLASTPTIAVYELTETMALLEARSDPQRHPLIAGMIAGSGPLCVDITQTGLFNRRRTLAAACRRSSIPTLPPVSRFVSRFLPWLGRMQHDDLVNTCAATWRLWVATQVDEAELTPAVRIVVSEMDAWLAESRLRDKSRTLGGYVERRLG